MSHDSYRVTVASTLVRRTVTPADYVVRHEEFERELAAAARTAAEEQGATVDTVEVYAVGVRLLRPGIALALPPAELADADVVVMGGLAHHWTTMRPT